MDKQTRSNKMAIIQTVDKYQFIDMFLQNNTHKDNFTYKGLSLLYDYLDDLSIDLNEDIELDITALCCEYVELNIREMAEYIYNAIDRDLENAAADTANEEIENPIEYLIDAIRDNQIELQDYDIIAHDDANTTFIQLS